MTLGSLICAGLCLACWSHYQGTCESDEAAGEIQGEDGVICAPRCSSSYECPITLAAITAQPQCMLQNVDQAFYCGLLCQADAQCPSGAACRKVGTQNVGLCIHPLSFSDWARLSSRMKLGIGFPTAPSGSSKGFQIAKAYSALQSLKRRYSISDGDADVLTVKEMLAAASGPNGLTDHQRSGLKKIENLLFHQSSSPSLGSEVSTDLKYFGNNMMSGLPGWEREAESVVWNVENINRYGAASGLLRGLIEVAVVYLVCGAIYNYQTKGATGLQLIPHLGFWMDYPNLVMDGVKYATQMASQYSGREAPSFLDAGGFQTLGAAERDTFVNFEPSR